jgi:hypothetical protein
LRRRRNNNDAKFEEKIVNTESYLRVDTTFRDIDVKNNLFTKRDKMERAAKNSVAKATILDFFGSGAFAKTWSLRVRARLEFQKK